MLCPNCQNRQSDTHTFCTCCDTKQMLPSKSTGSNLFVNKALYFPYFQQYTYGKI